jgi:2-C-methyl-D-erythritol 4-phosphate cytidylyltransferase
MQTVAVVLAGGTGSRFGAGLPKQLQLLGGRTILARCVEAFDRAPGVDAVLVVTAAEVQDQVRREVSGFGKVADVVTGGDSRTESTRCAIGWLTSWLRDQDAGRGRAPDVARPAETAPARGGQTSAGPDCKVLFHDAARPLVDQRTIAECVAALDEWQAVGVVVASADTIVEITSGTIRRTLPRELLARCQTPQGFRLSVISHAYELAASDPGFDSSPATDDCGVVLRYLPGVPVRAVAGTERNMKITYSSDIAIAQALLDPD